MLRCIFADRNDRVPFAFVHVRDRVCCRNAKHVLLQLTNGSRQVKNFPKVRISHELNSSFKFRSKAII